MGATRGRLYFGLAFLLLAVQVYGNWNEAFLKDSFLLSETLECFQKPNNHYQAWLQRFQEFKVEIEADTALIDELAKLDEKAKKVFLQETYVLKKRPRKLLNEAFFWEMSLILSLNDYVTPSFPFMYSEKIVTVQPFENFTIGSWVVNPPLFVTQKVSLGDYFRAHILAFILGAADLSGMNIGVTPEGRIRFFDNEDVFHWSWLPTRTTRSFFIPYVSVAFDWPQYREQLGSCLASEMKKFVADLQTKKDDLVVYSDIRKVQEDVITDVIERIDFLNQFNFNEKTSFLDFIYFLYPNFSDGFDELSEIVSNILNRPVDHGIALFFTTRMIKYQNLSNDDREILDSWIERYVLSEY